MSHFIETTTGFRIGQTALANIGREIIHTRSTDTGDFARFAKDVDFFLWICRWFYNDADFMRHFTRVIRDTVFHPHCVCVDARVVAIYIHDTKKSRLNL